MDLQYKIVILLTGKDVTCFSVNDVIIFLCWTKNNACLPRHSNK